VQPLRWQWLVSSAGDDVLRKTIEWGALVAHVAAGIGVQRLVWQLLESVSADDSDGEVEDG
jgi:hypothetical protein